MSVRTATTLPTFVVIGALKCGTTSLQHYLTQHPEIQMPSRKETDFFSGPPNGIPYATGSKRVASLDEYEQLFDPTSPARGEASPNYTTHPRRKDTAARLHAVAPDAKLIYLVRDPVARTTSHYHHRLSVEGERRSLREALSDLDDPYSPYTCPSLYAMQLELYLEHFPQENIMVIDQADLYVNREAVLREIFGFLTVDTSFTSPLFAQEINTGRERRTYSPFIVLVRRAQRSPLQRLPRGLRVKLRRSVEQVISSPLQEERLNDELRARLQELYAPDVKRLRELTGKAFSTWSV